jgi:signal transduction histidine kinase
MTERASELEREQRARLANMRQDLLAPVTALVGYGEMLIEEARRLQLAACSQIWNGFWLLPKSSSTWSTGCCLIWRVWRTGSRVPSSASFRPSFGTTCATR